MSDVAIRVENLGKLYRIGQGRTAQYATLRDRMASALSTSIRQLRSVIRPTLNGAQESLIDSIWALKDVSFDVKQGEVVGIIGRNGAGKSTLLKILARITEPTKGYAEIRGRITSLLEVGTGFHPELTGHENIYLNAAILGMKRTEIARKFDEIVAFAEIEKFIDTPVKHYSSGMYIRLAFAVAAHMELEILIVDEVLAVGDAAFQQKCLGKMGEVAKDGRTILFVSHDLTNISVLCQSAILLENGENKAQGSTKNVIDLYIGGQKHTPHMVTWDLEQAPGDDVARITRVGVTSADGATNPSLSIATTVPIEMEYVILRDNCRINPVFIVKNPRGVTVFSTANYEDTEWGNRIHKPGRYATQCIVPPHLLNDGPYMITAGLVQDTRLPRAVVENCVTFSILDTGETRGGYLGAWEGIVRPRCMWSSVQL